MSKKKALLILAGALCLLTACGDDLSITVPAPGESLPVCADGQAETDDTDDIEDTDDTEDEGQMSQDVEPEEITITISAAGDATLGNYFGQDYSWSFREMWEKQQDASYFLENVYDIFSGDDMTVVNLEGSLTRAEERRENQTYCISGDPEYVNILTEGSVEAVTMANNHRLDYFEQGTKDTVAALDDAGIAYAYDSHLGIYETKGIRIGFVAVNEVGQGAGVEKYLRDGIGLLQEEGADLILACCHWGVERENYPEEYQQSLGKQCIDWGADLVLGHHPHVLQGIEEYKGKYIVYSLGNFCFGANRNPADKDCIIFQQTFTFLDGERQTDTEARVIPCSISSVSNRNDYKPTPAGDDEARRILDRMNEYSMQFGVQLDEEGYIVK